MKFTEQQLKNWQTYESIRQGGLFNMFDPRAMAMTSMSAEEWTFCMKHYSALKQEVQGAAA
jgi:hypothetical protein